MIVQAIQDSKYFTEDELKCSCCGKLELKEQSFAKLCQLREEYNKPIKVNSAYRCSLHPDEASKNKKVTGDSPHPRGEAYDIAVRSRYERAQIVHLAIKMGFKGIGISKNFVHIDDRDYFALWIYPGTR